jgi:NAD(P)H-hydrate epimerase
MALSGLTLAQMREVDRLMVEDFGITLLQMMEHAGRGLAEVARRSVGGSLAEARVLVLAGPGNNGGGGLTAARHLANAGAEVHVALSAPPPLSGRDAERQRLTLRHMRIPGSDRGVRLDELPELLAGADLVLDALLGYSGHGDPREPIASLIHAVNATTVPCLALDLPSGLDGDTGVPRDPTMRAVATLTLAWPKVGLLASAAQPYIGRLYLADIGVPTEILATLGIPHAAVFARGPVVQVRPEGDGWEPEPLSA